MRKSGLSAENNFVGGLVTEKTGFNFPENSVTDCMNVVFNKDGSITRRGGIQPEADYTSEGTEVPTGVNRGYTWFISTDQGPVQFFVFQRGTTVYFYDQGSNALSRGKKDFTINLAAYKTAGSTTDIERERCSFTSGNNYLFIAMKYIDTLWVEYDLDSDSITVNRITLKIRDFEGLDDGLDPDERPNTLSDEHEYNLYNQGWPTRKVRVSRGDDKDLENPKGKNKDAIKYFENGAGAYPSNAEVWWQYKNQFDLMSDTWFNRFGIGNRLVARGSKILTAFNQIRKIGSKVLDTKSSEGLRSPAVAFYAGRVFYAGPTVGGFSNTLYFSRLIRNEKDFGQCYQDNDPTSETIPDLLATDGGAVNILDIGEIINMMVYQQTLFLFATNGVWLVSGADFGGFTADSYQIKKISSIPTLSSWSFVDVDGLPMWWTLDGIYTITGDGQSYQVQNVSNEKIKTWYEEIDGTSKEYAQGTYNREENVVEWGYRHTAVTNTPEDYWQYDRILKLDLNIQAWYPWEMPPNYYFLLPLTVQGSNLTTQDVNVVNSSDVQVVDSIGRNVVTDLQVFTDDPSVTKYFTFTETVFPARDQEIQHPKQDNGTTNSVNTNVEEVGFHRDQSKWIHMQDANNVRVYSTVYVEGGPPTLEAEINLTTLTGVTPSITWNCVPGQGDAEYFFAWPNLTTGGWVDEQIYMINYDGTVKELKTDLPTNAGSWQWVRTLQSPNTGNTFLVIMNAFAIIVKQFDEDGWVSGGASYADGDGGSLDGWYNNPQVTMGDDDVIWFLHAPGTSANLRYIGSHTIGLTGGINNFQTYDLGATYQAASGNKAAFFYWARGSSDRIVTFDANTGNLLFFSNNPGNVQLQSSETVDMTTLYSWTQNNMNGVALLSGMNNFQDDDWMVFSDDLNKIYRYNMRTGVMTDTIDMSGQSTTDPECVIYDSVNQMCIYLNENTYNYFVYFAIPASRGVLSFSEVSDSIQSDWDSDENPAFFETGYRIRGQLMMDASTNYISFVSKTLSGQGYLVSGKWDYSTNSLSSNKRTTQQQGYKHKQYQDYSIRRLKMRGEGKVIQIRVDSDGTKPFHIIGWITMDSIEDRP